MVIPQPFGQLSDKFVLPFATNAKSKVGDVAEDRVGATRLVHEVSNCSFQVFLEGQMEFRALAFADLSKQVRAVDLLCNSSSEGSD